MEEKGTVFKKPTCSEKLDGDASSRRGPDLKNNGTCCSMDKLVSKQRVVLMVPHPAVVMTGLPRSQTPMCSKTRYDSSLQTSRFAPSTSLLPIDGEHQHTLEGSRYVIQFKVWLLYRLGRSRFYRTGSV